MHQARNGLFHRAGPTLCLTDDHAAATALPSLQMHALLDEIDRNFEAIMSDPRRNEVSWICALAFRSALLVEAALQDSTRTLEQQTPRDR